MTRHFDFAYITIHGTPGEDGRLQGYFDYDRYALLVLRDAGERFDIQ